jgi:hypothetical protein
MSLPDIGVGQSLCRRNIDPFDFVPISGVKGEKGDLDCRREIKSLKNLKY